MKALDLARGEVVAVEVAAEALLDAGAQDLHGDGASTPLPSIDDGLVHLGDRGGCDRRPELHEVILELAAEGLLDRLARFRLENGGNRSCKCARSRASSGPITSARVARNCPSLM